MTTTLQEAESRARSGAQSLQVLGAVCGLCLPFAFFGLFSSLQRLDVPALAAMSLAIFGVVPVFATFIKYLYLSRQPERLPIKPDQILAEAHAGLDVEGFNDLRREFMLLGFEPLGGCRILHEGGALDHRIFDVWAHPTYACYATIDQTLPFSGPRRQARLTYWTGLGDRWWYATHNTRAKRLEFVLRTGRFAWTASPDGGVENLLRLHLERREDAFAATGRQPDLPLSLDSFLNGEAVRYSATRDAMRRKNVLVAIFELLFFDSLSHDEWMGDFNKLM